MKWGQLTVEGLFFFFCRNRALVHFVQREDDDQHVEPELVEGLDPLLEGDFLLEFGHVGEALGSEELVVDELLALVVLAAEPDEDPVEELQLLLLVFAAHVAEHGLGEGADDDGDDLLQGQPECYNCYIAIDIMYI